MKTTVVMLVASMALASSFAAKAGDNSLFTGDKKLACEAILCLSTGKRPDQCAKPVHRYFSIHARRLKDTIRKRKNFLKLCPSANDDSKMEQLVDDIASGAGRCDAATLNRTLRVYRPPLYGRPNGIDRPYNPRDPRPDDRWVVRDTLPSHCAAYANDAYTDQTNLTTAHYVGTPGQGGHWEDGPADANGSTWNGSGWSN